jgi:hypothetical protein
MEQEQLWEAITSIQAKADDGLDHGDFRMRRIKRV